ncbi:hypothetical protein B0A55_01394 [Friedmanniomyces simplex]|uniref:Uncharacterized protein n=1 Tax=Friedmanniomyces simplex TaxID=329884 RepID=A0A4U0XXD2_9PEZI|nr:hypothetical protein B0A55_01394 [Friedmanniomyces simplex]
MLPVYTGAHRESVMHAVTSAELSDAIDGLISEELARAIASADRTRAHSTGTTPEMEPEQMNERESEHVADYHHEHKRHIDRPGLRCTRMGIAANSGCAQAVSTDSLDVSEQLKPNTGHGVPIPQARSQKVVHDPPFPALHADWSSYITSDLDRQMLISMCDTQASVYGMGGVPYGKSGYDQTPTYGKSSAYIKTQPYSPLLPSSRLQSLEPANTLASDGEVLYVHPNRQTADKPQVSAQSVSSSHDGFAMQRPAGAESMMPKDEVAIQKLKHKRQSLQGMHAHIARNMPHQLPKHKKTIAAINRELEILGATDSGRAPSICKLESSHTGAVQETVRASEKSQPSKYIRETVGGAVGLSISYYTLGGGAVSKLYEQRSGLLLKLSKINEHETSKVLQVWNEIAAVERAHWDECINKLTHSHNSLWGQLSWIESKQADRLPVLRAQLQSMEWALEELKSQTVWTPERLPRFLESVRATERALAGPKVKEVRDARVPETKSEPGSGKRKRSEGDASDDRRSGQDANVDVMVRIAKKACTYVPHS